MTQGKKIIVCEIFKNELNTITSESSNPIFYWIDAALHANPDKMEEAISQAISKIEKSESDVGLLFGNGCHPDMCSIAGKHGVALPAEKNCIHAFLGSAKVEELEKNRTMIITPGWLDAWPGIMDGLGWDEVDARINIGRYNKILLLDPGIIQIDDEILIEFYDLVQVPVEIMEISLDYFTEVVNKIIL